MEGRRKEGKKMGCIWRATRVFKYQNEVHDLP